jgi:transcriptional regulator with XRE-family HTH domain
MNIDYVVIGNRIKDSRRNKNYTQENLAEYLDVSITYVSRIERGKTTINLNMLSRICDYLEIDPSYLLTGCSYSSEDYLRNGITDMLKDCSPEKVKFIAKVIKPIIEYKEK